MDIGKEKPPVIVEPVEDPFKSTPPPEPARAPDPEPVEPEREPVK